MRKFIALLGVIAGFLWWRTEYPATTILALHLDQHFDEVARNSTYPVAERSNVPTEEFDGSGVIWVTKPAVIIQYDDANNGFTLPSTTFAAVVISRYRVSSIRTSPMLEALPFDQAMAVLENIQGQLKAAGWQPEDESQWFDLSAQGRRKLYAVLFKHAETASIVVPKKNLAMYLNIWCFGDHCDRPNDKARFLIDVSVGKKSYYDYKGE